MTPLCVFLASSLNVELVYVILSGICEFAFVFSAKAKFGDVKIDADRVIKHSEAETQLLMNELRMENVKDWSDTRMTEFIEKNYNFRKSSAKLIESNFSRNNSSKRNSSRPNTADFSMRSSRPDNTFDS